jgi:hypothetical protein
MPAEVVCAAVREDLSELERRLVDCVGRGEALDCAVDGTTPDVMEAVADWECRVVSADLLTRLLTGEAADHRVHVRKGLRLRGAWVAGGLDLAHADVEAPVVFEVCRFEKEVDLTGARVRSFTMTRCELPALLADELDTPHSLRLGHCTFSSGPVRLVGARVGGDLVLTGSKLAGTDERGQALVAHRLHAGAASLDRGFETAGSVRMPGGTIDTYLDMSGARLMGADERGEALDAVRLRVGDEAFLSGGFEAAGALAFRGANIDGNLDMTGAKLLGTDSGGNSLAGDGLRVGGGARLRDGFEAIGAVRLWGGDVGAQLNLRGATLAGSDANGDALVADDVHVGANALLTDGFEAAGAVGFRGASIKGNFELNGATLAGTDTFGNALRADRLHVRGNLLMRDGYQAAGETRLLGAKIDGHLALVRARNVGRLVLQNARCGSFRHERDSWSPAGELVLHGFRFDRLVEDTSWRQRLEWVRRQGFEHWSPDPYEQLAAYYTSIGDESAARRIRIARHDDELAHVRSVKRPGSLAYRFWRRPFGWLVGYGYRRWPAGLLLVVTLVAAAVVFRLAAGAGAMTPSRAVASGPAVASGQLANGAAADDRDRCGDPHPCFNALVYGADVVLPVVDFGQDSAWRPSESTAWGRWAAGARWVFIALGWVLASVFVAAFTRLVQRD